MIDLHDSASLRGMVLRALAALASVLLSLSLLWADDGAERHAEEEVPCEEEAEVCIISPYDDLMRAAQEETGADWRLLCAIAREESCFIPDVVSAAGAVGLMQIMPSVGEHYGVDSASLAEPSNNIRVAASLLTDIERIISLPATVSDEDRLQLVLACYNGGVGHVNDARRLAEAFGENMNSWPVVARYLRLKSDPAYYEHEVVSSGCFSGGRRTAAYVRNVMSHYEQYRLATEGRAGRDGADAAAGRK